MRNRIFILILLGCLYSMFSVGQECSRKEYKISDFNIAADSSLVQTKRIQNMIDAVSEKGGGVIRFTSGVYVTGSIELKSNVCLFLERDALIWGSTNPYDYRASNKSDKVKSSKANDNSALALITANGAENISIEGQGTIDGRGLELALHIDSLHHKGVLIDPEYNYRRNRPRETARPKLFRLSHTKGIVLCDVTLRNSACWGVTLDLCKDVILDNLTVYNRAYWNNDGLDITDCYNVRITRCDINAADDGICLKSYNPGYSNDSIYIADCRVCSSASAVKFGTASHGGFKNIVIDNIEVYDTFRSAIAIETVDGGDLENVRVTRINARNTGNAIFIRLGHRSGEQPGKLKNVYIGQMKVEIPFGRTDEAYDLRGPSVPFFHNPIPSSITGIPGHAVENVLIEDVEIRCPGRASKGMAYMPLWRLDSVPEVIKNYPEFSMFGELPSWGFYIRHAKGITFRNLSLKLSADDFRPAFVLDDADGVQFENLSLPYEKNQIVTRKSTNILVDDSYNIVTY